MDYLNVFGRHPSQLAVENHLATKGVLKGFTIQRHNLNTIVHAQLVNLHIYSKSAVFRSHMQHLCVQPRIMSVTAAESLQITLDLSAMEVAKLANAMASRRKVAQQGVVGFVTARGGKEAFCGLDKEDTHGKKGWLCAELHEWL